MNINWPLARWWIAANAAGAILALAVLELNYQSHVRAHEYHAHPPRYALYVLLWLAALIVMGAVDAIACCWLDMFIRVRSRALHGVISVALAIVLAIAIPIAAGAIAQMIEMILAIWIFLPTGILFGVLLAIYDRSASTGSRREAVIDG